MTAPIVNTSPHRRPGSLRRTSTLDARWFSGLTGPLDIVGQARDLATAGDGAASVIGTGRLELTVSPTMPYTVVRIASPEFDVPELVSTSGAKLPKSLREAGVQPSALVSGLVADVPLLLLIAQTAYTHNGMVPSPGSAFAEPPVNVCAGWREESSLTRHVRTTGSLPAMELPDAPDLLDQSDPESWHHMPELEPIAMRRLRRADVFAGIGSAAVEVEALHRDLYLGGDGPPGVVHELTLRLAVGADGAILAAHADMHRTPADLCVLAVDSAERLVGRAIGDVDSFVRSSFSGVSTCTHLNDLARWAARTYEGAAALR